MEGCVGEGGELGSAFHKTATIGKGPRSASDVLTVFSDTQEKMPGKLLFALELRE